MKKKLILGLAVLSSIALASGNAGGNKLPELGRRDKFVAEYTSKSAYIKAGSALNVQICGEGMVLLKNKDNILPFDGVSKVSVFGKASTSLQYGGGGSGSGRVNGETQIDLQTSLKKAGYTVNPNLTTFYKTNSKSGEGRKNGNTNWSGVSEATIGETPVAQYSNELKASFDEYNDAAIVVLARGGTEGADCKTIDARDFNVQDKSCSAIKGDSFTTKHYLQLSDNEEDMIAMVKEKFNKVVILINSGNIFQCDQFENDDKVQAVLWMGTPGAAGTEAVGKILKGEINPSGRTVDTWTRDFKEDPSFQNFADNSQTYYDDKAAYAQDTMINPDGTPTNSSAKASWVDAEHHVANGALNGVKPAQYISYEEGIYVDYRYYETKYADMEAAQKGSGDTWYAGKKGVIYPFGYGLSYSTFTQEIVSIDVPEGTILTGAKKRINIKVKVKNTGNKAGKDVVQIYWKAPYTKGGIEKAYEVLCAFGKTDVLEPNEEQEIELSFYLQDVASYDFADKNNNGFKGYELDGGDYYISLNKNAHEEYESKKVTVQKNGIKYQYDRFTGVEVKNRFSDNDFFSSLPLEKDVGFDQMSREDFDGTFPSHPTIADRTLKEGSRVEEFLTHKFELADLDVYHNGYVSEAAYKAKTDIPENWSQQATALKKSARTQLSAMKGVALDDPRWDDFLNEFTYAELQKFVQDGCFHSPSLDAIGKPQTSDSDGPSQFSIIWWAGAPTVAATYNVDLAHKQGEMVGIEGHLDNKYGWFGPAVNTHRSPFGGRNFEYYSADPFLMGRIAANVVGAATEKGIYCYFKHFAVNDQEKGREGVSTFVTEQALREIYLKSFQMVFEEGKSMGVMSSYNRLGNMETAASYPLLTEVLRGEWGFKGAVLSDMTHHGNGAFDHKCYENINNRVLSGCNAQLDNSQYTGDIEAKWTASANDGKGAPTFTYTDKDTGEKKTVESYSWWYAVRKMAQEELYIYANSGGMDKTLIQTVNGDVTVTDEKNGKVVVGLNEEVEITINHGETIKGVTYPSVEYSIDEIYALPEGLTLENGVIKGTPTKEGDNLVHILVKCINEDETSKQYAKEIRIIVEDKNDVEKEAGGMNCSGNCEGSVLGIASLIGALGCTGVAIVLRSKKREENI